jgi:homoserine O-acetyltransferase
MANRKLHIVQGNVTFAEDGPFKLELGGTLSPVTIRFAVYGEPNAACDNVILLCHALSGSARADEWWPELFAPGGVFADDRWCVISSNILGSRYGSTGPTSINTVTGLPYGDEFPIVTMGDMVRAQTKLLEQWGVDKLHTVLGGSIGGMQALEWALRYPDKVERCIAIAATPLNSLGLALNHLQRQTIAANPEKGLQFARALAMCTYKSSTLFAQRHGRKPNRKGISPWESSDGRFDVAGYLDFQGEIFAGRFDPQTYNVITRAMDLWDPERDHGDDVWARIEAKTTLVGIDSDWLFPAADVRSLANSLRAQHVNVSYRELHSTHGHDAFLAEPKLVNEILHDVLNEPAGKAGVSCAALAGLEKCNGTIG